MRILISGAGIAGLTLAYWLRRAGHEPVVVERAQAPERNGYLIGIRGGSITVLQKMGLLDAALVQAKPTLHYQVLDGHGRRINGGRYLSYRDDERGKLPLNRADLQAILYAAVKDDVAVQFGTTLSAIRPTSTGVEVDFSGGRAGSGFDLVIGADGVRSWVRKTLFGEAGPKPLPAAYAAFIAPTPRPVESYVQFAPGRMSVIYDLGRGEVGGLFILRELPEPRAGLRQHLIDLHRENGLPIANVLAALPDTTSLFADPLVAVHLPAWSRGRVGLVGDAAYSLTPASGFGATAALAGGYLLAEALAAEGPAGLAAYERRLRPAIERRQRAAAGITGQLVTRSPLLMFVRENLLRLMREDGVYKARKAEMFGITA
jgi:2-polyprenyl-6-methoxyphenol hydroxylase-like FAD-dependent oxidoreductase